MMPGHTKLLFSCKKRLFELIGKKNDKKFQSDSRDNMTLNIWHVHWKLSKLSWSIVKASRKEAHDEICCKMYNAMLANNNCLLHVYYATKTIDYCLRNESPTFDWLTR